MSLINNQGSESNPLWIITGTPYENDAPQSTIFSGGFGWNWKKIWRLSNLPEAHIRSIYPCLGSTYDPATILYKTHELINQHKPTFIILLTDELLNYFVPETTQIKEKNSSIRKWAGSILKCETLQYDHYIFCCQPPDYLTRNWDEHEIAGYIDLGHVKEEYDFYIKNKFLQPPPRRSLITAPSFGDLINLLQETLNKFYKKELIYISNDIETIRPKEKSFYRREMKHPGLIYCTAIAWSKDFSFSFSLWDYEPFQCVKIWRLLAEILANIPQIGQNYFEFDSHYLERMGFRICLSKCLDTRIRHHILWPGLPHSLQFQTKQYTREKFYKDEGKNFRLAFKKQYMEYNAKDSAVTFEIKEKQDEEFSERKWLQ